MITEQDRNDAQKAFLQAGQALRLGDRTQARRWASLAARLDPTIEQPWLLLAGIASPQASVAYLKKALEINPQSEAARKGMHWAVERMRVQNSTIPAALPAPEPDDTLRVHVRPASVASATPVIITTESTRPIAIHRRSTRRPVWAIAIFLVVFGGLCLLGLSGALIVTAGSGDASRAIAFLLNPSETPTPTLKPSLTATRRPTSTATKTKVPTSTATPVPSATQTTQPTATFTQLPTETALPTDTPSPEPTLTPEVVVPPTEVPSDTAEPAPPTGVVVPDGTHWVDVDLTNQRAYAYEGNTMVREFIVSTGTWEHPTVTGQFYIYVKYRYADMKGPGYYLADVPYVMYFYQGYGLHGTYWHHNFGTPMSHGCVNLKTEDAEWLFGWADVGTLVNIHY